MKRLLHSNHILALIRLGMLYVMLCFALLYLGLALRTWTESNASLRNRIPPDNAPATQIPYVGVTVQLEQYSSHAQSLSALERLASQGVGWVRQRFDWQEIETAEGDYDWRASDAMLAAIDEAQLTPVVVLDGSPAWARASADRHPTDNALAPPADPATFARFAGAFARRYRDRVRFYQIWDEPNISPHWGNRHIEPIAYAQLLIEAGQSIKANDGDAVIIVAALAPTQDQGHTALDEVTFLQRVFAAGAAPMIDAVSLQPFGFGYRPDHDRSDISILNYRRVAWVRRAMNAAGVSQTPIWISRFGWNRHPNSPWRSVSREDQLAFASEALAYARAEWPWVATVGWAIDRPANADGHATWGFALDDRLLTALMLGTQSTPVDDASAISDRLPIVPVLALLLAIAVIGRGWSAARPLPWSRWAQHYRSLPIATRLVIWASLVLGFYYATWPPLLGLIWLGFACLTAATPTWGLMLAAALLPFHIYHKEIAIVDLQWMAPPAQAALIACVPAIFIAAWRRLSSEIGRNLNLLLRRLRFMDWMALSWLFLSLASIQNVWHRGGYLQGMTDLVIMPLLGYLAIRLLVQSRADWAAIATALFIGGVLTAGQGLTAWIAGQGTTADGLLRLVGPHFSPNHTALYLIRTLFTGMGFMLLAGVLHGEKRGRSEPPFYLHWVLPATLLVLCALGLTASRGAWMLGIPAGATLLLLLNRNHLRRRWDGLRPTLMRTPIVLAAPLMVGVGLSLLLTFERLVNGETVLRRLAIWSNSMRLWRDFPLWGVGPGGFYWSYPAYLQPGSLLDPNILHPHNVWLEFGSMWGLIGLSWLGILLIYGIRQSALGRKLLKSPYAGVAMGLLAGLAAALLHGQVDAFATLPDLAAWNWMALGLLTAYAFSTWSDGPAAT